MPKLDNISASPLYKQLIDAIYSDIKNGAYPVHSRIPSEQALCQKYHISRVTVRKALASLTNSGLLVRKQGKGTFVAIPKIKRNLRDVTGFSEFCRDMGKNPSTQLIHAYQAQVSLKDATSLHLKEHESVIEIMRLRLADNDPVMLETNVFPMKYAFLLEEGLTRSLYETLYAHRIVPDRATHDISLTYATAQHAKYLQVEPDVALLNLYEVIYDSHGSPIHTSMQFIRGDKFTFRI